MKSLKRYQDIKQHPDKYVCAGCGVSLSLKGGDHKKSKKKKKSKPSRAWRGYFCEETQREFVFHNRLCVKLRKAKEKIRDAVHEHTERNDGASWISKMQIDFLQNEGLDEEFEPNSFFTTFDETVKKKVEWRETIRSYYKECVNTDLRGYDIDEGDRFASIPQAIKYLDQREFAVPMFRWLMRSVQIKEFSLFWALLSFFSSYIHTPKLLLLLKEYSSVLFALHDPMKSKGELIDLLTILCEGALYPIATCLYISAYLKEHGEQYWTEEETESLSNHFRKMARNIIDEIESEHLVAIILETPTNIYADSDQSASSAPTKGMSVIDIAIKYKMLNFLQNHKISRIATTLWSERKIIHPRKRFGEELSWYDVFHRLRTTPAKFYFSPSGLNIVRLGLYLTYLLLFSSVTYQRRYNYEPLGSMFGQETTLWFFNVAAILYEFYKCLSGPSSYFSLFSNVIEFTKAAIWILLFYLRLVDPAPLLDCLFVVRSDDPLLVDCSFGVLNSNNSLNVECTKLVYREDPYICSEQRTRNTLHVEVYMALWSAQCVLFWLSLLFYLERTRSVGPMLKMIGLMFKDMLNFLMLVVLFWMALSFGIYYTSGSDPDLPDLSSLSNCMFLAMRAILGDSEIWPLVERTSSSLGLPRSILLQSIIALGTVVGTVLLLNLLIAMLANTYKTVTERTSLEVNYIRIVQSYGASKEVSLIPPPLNYLAFGLMAVWLLVDLLITACTARTKMLNDWYFTPLNRNVFSAGDFIQYRDVEASSGHSSGADTISSGYVQHSYTSEVALIAVANRMKRVHKRDILKIRKDKITERLSDADANGLCASIISSGRYYCKYCRYFFHGDQVGNVEQIENLFRSYDILLDMDDTGKLGNMLGQKRDRNRRRHHDRNGGGGGGGAAATTDTAEDKRDYNQNLRTLGVGQLCPECYRPFYCSEDHFDEIQRLQYLSEVCSFWVFMLLLYVPLCIAFAVPAAVSKVYQIILGREQLIGGKKAKLEKQQRKLSKKVKMSQSDPAERRKVVDCFDDIRPWDEYVRDSISNKLSVIHKKIRETQADDEEHNIVTQTTFKLDQMRRQRLSAAEKKEREIVVKKLYAKWTQKLDAVLEMLKKGRSKKSKKKTKLGK